MTVRIDSKSCGAVACISNMETRATGCTRHGRLKKSRTAYGILGRVTVHDFLSTERSLFEQIHGAIRGKKVKGIKQLVFSIIDFPWPVLDLLNTRDMQRSYTTEVYSI